MKTDNVIYFRPPWTCGRYHQESQSAIYFNNIEGAAYFFEDESADIIGTILSIKRGDSFYLSSLMAKTTCKESDVVEFLQQIETLQLITSTSPSSSYISEYRQATVQNFHNKQGNIMDITLGTDAERVYGNRSKVDVLSVAFELTYNCSEKCIHCYNPGASRNNDEKDLRSNIKQLSLTDYKRIIDDLYDNGLVRVCLTGGDPFSYPYAWEIIEYLYEKQIAIDIFTNGQRLVGKEEKLASYFPTTVGISIYSTQAEVHDKITRINGSWEKSMQVFKKLSSLSVPMQLKCSIMQQNVNSYYGLRKIAAENNAYLQLEAGIFDSLSGDKCVSKYLRLSPEQLEIVLRDKLVPISLDKEDPDFGTKKHDRNTRVCRAGDQVFSLSPDGTLTPCISFHTALGNLKTTTVKNVLSDNRSINYLKELHLSKYHECGKHSYCNFCNICPGLNFAQHGDPLLPADNCCYIAKNREQIAIKLKNGTLSPILDSDLEQMLLGIKTNEKTIAQSLSVNHFDKELKIKG